MTAAHSAPPTGSDPRAAEPSMEEILASIRRIIADDQSLPGHGALRDLVVSRSPLDEPAPAAPVHVLHPEPAPQSVEPASAAPARVISPPTVAAPDPGPAAHGPIAAPQFASPSGPVEARDAASKAPPHVLRSEPPHVEPAPASVDVTFGASNAPAPDEPDAYDYEEPIGYDATQGAQEATPALFSAATDHSVTSAFNMLAATRLADNSDELLSMTKEMIRPILKAWLDDNLPSMVERLVRAEIERVSRGGR